MTTHPATLAEAGASPAPTSLDGTGTSSYLLQPAHPNEPAEADSSRRSDCNTLQQAPRLALPVVEALRAIGDQERERVFAERFYELLPFAGTRPQLVGRRFPPPPKGVPATSNAWRTVRKDANAAGNVWHSRADSIENCGATVVVLRCRCCGNLWAIPDPCGSRFCPKCVRAVRQRNIAEVQRVVGGMPGRRRFLTLTVRSSHDLRRMLDGVLRSFSRLRARRWWKRRVRAGVYSIEVTHTPGTGWHVHVHAILWGDFLPRSVLIAEWQAATGCRCPRPRNPPDGGLPVLCCHSLFEDRAGEFERADAARSVCVGCMAEPMGQDIRAANDEDVSELCKYVGKDLGTAGGFLADRDLLVEFLRTMWGRRTWSTFGAAFDKAREQEEARQVECPGCNSTDVAAMERTTAARWQLQEAAAGKPVQGNDRLNVTA